LVLFGSKDEACRASSSRHLFVILRKRSQFEREIEGAHHLPYRGALAVIIQETKKEAPHAAIAVAS